MHSQVPASQKPLMHFIKMNVNSSSCAEDRQSRIEHERQRKQQRTLNCSPVATLYVPPPGVFKVYFCWVSLAACKAHSQSCSNAVCTSEVSTLATQKMRPAQKLSDSPKVAVHVFNTGVFRARVICDKWTRGDKASSAPELHTACCLPYLSSASVVQGPTDALFE